MISEGEQHPDQPDGQDRAVGLEAPAEPEIRVPELHELRPDQIDLADRDGDQRRTGGVLVVESVVGADPVRELAEGDQDEPGDPGRGGRLRD